jgi:protein-tyrosine phosphatase
MNLDQVLPQVVLGSCPETPADIDRLEHAFGVTAVLNLQTDEDIDYLGLDWDRLQARYRASGMQLRRVPARDFDPEDLRRNLPDGVEALRRLLADDQMVYVHCTAGIGRSATVVVAYLHWVQGWDLDGAAEHVNRLRPCSPNLEAIRLAGNDRDHGTEPGELT